MIVFSCLWYVLCGYFSVLKSKKICKKGNDSLFFLAFNPFLKFLQWQLVLFKQNNFCSAFIWLGVHDVEIQYFWHCGMIGLYFFFIYFLQRSDERWGHFGLFNLLPLILIVGVSIFLGKQSAHHYCIVHTQMILHFLRQAPVKKDDEPSFTNLNGFSNFVEMTF